MMRLKYQFLTAGCVWLLFMTTDGFGQQPFLNTDVETTIRSAGAINTKKLEFSPAYYANGIVFVSAREESKVFDRKIGLPFFELLYAEFRQDGLPGRATSFSPNIRSRFHEGPVSFTTDERTIYFTRSNMIKGREQEDAEGKKIQLKIYQARKGPDDWEDISELPFCSDDYTVAQPALFRNGRKMVFASDMPGGYGGMDLYIVEMDQAGWSEPVNLGPDINTQKNELFPFVHRNGVLFFASDGHQGMGGLDIFAVDLAQTPYPIPVNLGKPFNSRKDDLGLIIDNAGLSGFFSSARKGGKGKDDIYAFTCASSLFAFPVEELEIALSVKNNATQAAVPGAKIWAFEIDQTGPVGLDGLYETELIPSETAEGDLVLRLTRKRDLINKQAQDTTDVSGTASLSVFAGTDYLFVVDAAGFILREEVLKAHVLRDQGAATFYMDPVLPKAGTDCKTITGIIRNLRTGTAVPLASVSFQSSCTEGISVIQADMEGRYTFCLGTKCPVDMQVIADGFHEQALKIDVPEETTRTVYLVPDSEEKPTSVENLADLEPGSLIILERIYYDFNKSVIRTGSAEDLDVLVDLMFKYPSMRVELAAHTDTRGTKSYNMELSRRRAISARDYVVDKGIAASRIDIRPMGELQPRNQCLDGVPCREAEHAINRRTEIRILEMDDAIQVEYGDKVPHDNR